MSKTHIVGHVLKGLVFLALGASAAGKLAAAAPILEGFAKFGISATKLPAIGTLELLVALLYIVPRTALLGAVLVAAYLGAATLTHLRVDDPFVAPVILGVVAWVGYGLTRPDVVVTAFRPAKP